MDFYASLSFVVHDLEAFNVACRSNPAQGVYLLPAGNESRSLYVVADSSEDAQAAVDRWVSAVVDQAGITQPVAADVFTEWPEGPGQGVLSV